MPAASHTPLPLLRRWEADAAIFATLPLLLMPCVTITKICRYCRDDDDAASAVVFAAAIFAEACRRATLMLRYDAAIAHAAIPAAR